MAPGQIPLPFARFQRLDFDSFEAGANDAVLEALARSASGEERHNLYLWGPCGSGKSHLLQAVSTRAADNGLRVAFLPLAQIQELDPAMLQGLELLDLVCIDDLQFAAGSAPWEQALFHLFNRLRERHSPLLMSADQGPQSLAVELPDLKSRLVWDLVFHLQPLDEPALLRALQRRARSRLFDFPDEVLEYLVRRVPRDTPALFDLLDQLDQASLASKKKITIPFVKEVLRLKS